MTLRSKLLVMFAAFAVVPLATVGVIGYVRSLRALEALLAVQTSLIAERAAAEVRDRYEAVEANVALLAENAEIARLYVARNSGSAAEEGASRSRAGAYLREVWTALGPDYSWASFRDARGREVYRLGDAGPAALAAGQGSDAPDPSSVYVLTHAVPTGIPDGREAKTASTASTARSPTLGEVRVAVRTEALLARGALDARFGRSGYTVALDRASGRVVYGDRGVMLPASLGGAPSDGAGVSASVSTIRIAADERSAPEVMSGATPAALTTVKFHERDSTRVATAAALAAPAWTIVSAAALDEFSAPFERIRTANLALVLGVAGLAAAGFLVVLWRSTQSLRLLTSAADEVGRGNFAPPLPSASRDDVGRLAVAFGLMAGKVGDMMRQLEASRQMAAVGEFASEIAHEIRNPLTSIKLNLQKLARLDQRGALAAEASRPIAISLREVQRLDRVVHGVLRFGRPREPRRRVVRVHALLVRVLQTARPQLERHAIDVRASLDASTDVVLGDAAELEGALLNLVVNAIDAMPGGGVLSVATEIIRDDDVVRVTTEALQRDGAPARLRIRISDTGAGVAAEARERIFRPFFTSKTEGTGLGLALALRCAEEHGGSLRLADGAEPGATFVMELPIAAEDGA